MAKINIFSIQQVIEITSKNENFVRQHIHRNHLASVKIDGKVFIEESALRKWASERAVALDEGIISLHSKARLKSQLAGAVEPEAKKSTCTRILLLASEDSFQLLACIVKQRQAQIANRVTEWSATLSNNNKLILLEKFDDNNSWVEDFIVRLSEGITINGYTIKSRPSIFTETILGQGETGEETDFPCVSPFKDFSCKLYEGWSLDSTQKFSLHRQIEDTTDDVYNSFGLDLRKYPENIGNILIANAVDAYKLHCACIGGSILRIESNATVETNPITVAVTVKKDKQVVAQKLRTISKTLVDIPFDTSFNFFDCQFFNAEGNCISHQAFYLMGEIHITMHAQTGSIGILDKSGKTALTIPQGITQSTIVTNEEAQKEIKNITAQGRIIRTLFNEKHYGNFFDFQRDELEKLINQILKLINDLSHKSACVYICDPYILRFLNSNNGKTFLLKLAGRMNSSPIRIICGQMADINFLETTEAIKKQLGKDFLRGIQIKSLGRADSDNKMRPYFHNRWLTNRQGKTYIFTNSLNGISEDGSTIIKVTSDFFEKQTDMLWHLTASDQYDKFEEISF